MGYCIKFRTLGSGSYGTVFLSEYRSVFSGSAVLAVKSSEFQRSYSLRLEGVFLEALKGCSDYIVQGFGEDISIEDGRRVYNLLLEYAPGGTLENLIESRGGGNIPESEISRYAYQLLRGIHDVHSRGIVHCDLKPANVLVFPCRCGCGANHLKIADFGLAKLAGKNMLGENHQGTLLYTSPESVKDGMNESPKDIWALGCMVAEMITGEPIWTSNSEEELEWNIALKEPEIPEGISPLAKSFLKRCFERNPNSRLAAEILLLHPFIAKDKPLKVEFDHLSAEVKNPFGSGGWVSKTDLFSNKTSIIPKLLSFLRLPAAFINIIMLYSQSKDANNAKKDSYSHYTYCSSYAASPSFDEHHLLPLSLRHSGRIIEEEIKLKLIELKMQRDREHYI